MKKIRYIILALFIMVFTAACSSGKAPGGVNGNEGSGNEIQSGNLGNNNIFIPEGHKIIYTVEYEIATEDSITPIIRGINEELYEVGGYVSSSTESLTYAKYIYKVPVDKLNQFLDKVDASEGVSQKKIESQDVTSVYNELLAEKEILEANKAAYLKMLENDKLSFDEIVKINDKISDLDIKLKTISKNIDSYNARIDYATVTIQYRNSQIQKEEGFLSGYVGFLSEVGKIFVLFIAYTAPFAIVAGAGIGVTVIIKRRKHK